MRSSESRKVRSPLFLRAFPLEIPRVYFCVFSFGALSTSLNLARGSRVARVFYARSETMMGTRPTGGYFNIANAPAPVTGSAKETTRKKGAPARTGHCAITIQLGQIFESRVSRSPSLRPRASTRGVRFNYRVSAEAGEELR